MSLCWEAPGRRVREHDDELSLSGTYEPELVVEDELEVPPLPCVLPGSDVERRISVVLLPKAI